MMRYIYLLCLLLGLSFLSYAADKETIVERHGRLSVDGVQLVDEKGEPLILRGVSLGWHNWWAGYYNANAVRQIANDWKATVVRAAIGVEPDGGYISNPQRAMQCLTQVVDAAIEQGVYVIIDWHSHGIRLEEAKTFFRIVAEKYKDSPNVIYELFNEPVHQSWDEVKAYSIELIRTIRAIDPDNIILVGNPHWCQDIHLAADDPITGYANLMYVMHFYAGTHKQWLRDRTDYALSKGLPVFISECAGMEATGDGPIDQTEWNAYIDWMNKQQLSWVAWSVSGKDESCSMLHVGTDPTATWPEESLKEWAKIVRAVLLFPTFADE
ncbi:glycoside hydrolase family 5 protein [Parabacteroides sp. PF5-6]|uniref:glycoside hydrolase family 5 protein n=1 Tax=Parabacteroides sp. PF5-6 TaxID=1742403 RepID=UPI002404FA19|nr:glycoside hydrolase family 5 protein [Parabacteroides sp. PF5-6]MDF9830108.1 endoglucanase [Parabacteroides sp. PF5-6]